MKKFFEAIISRNVIEKWFTRDDTQNPAVTNLFQHEKELRMPQFRELLATRMECLTNLGFKYIKSRQSYEIAEKDRIVTLYFDTLSKYSVCVSLRIIIRFKSIEKYYKAIIKEYNLSGLAWKIPECMDYAFVINPEDINSLWIELEYTKHFAKLVDVVKMMLPRICELMENIRTPKDVDRLYNNPPFFKGPFRGLYLSNPWGCLISLIAAKMASNPNYDNLAKEYHNFFESLVQEFPKEGYSEEVIQNWKRNYMGMIEAINDYFAKK